MGLRKLVASGPRKPGKSQGESSFSPGDYSQAFPGRIASGMAASPPGQKHNVESMLFTFKHQRELISLSKSTNFRYYGSRGLRPLVGDEPPMTACGGNLIGGEISRNKQSRHEGKLRRLRLRNWGEQPQRNLLSHHGAAQRSFSMDTRGYSAA